MSRVIKLKNLEIGSGRPKICCPVMGSTAEEVLEQAELANEANCDMIEFRADHFEDILDLPKVKSLLRKMKRACVKPSIFTLRRFEEGGKREIPIDYYRELLEMVAGSALSDLIDVEISAIDGDKEFIEGLQDCGVYVVMSKHDFDGTPSAEEIRDTYIAMRDLGADIAKVAYMPNSKNDVLNLMSATLDVTSDRSFCPVIAISMGKLGVVTRVIGEFLESAVTFAALSQASAPGQLNVKEMQGILDTLHGSIRKVVLVGCMGSGKTAVANALYDYYGLKKIDLNTYIEEKEQTTIADLADDDMELFLDKEAKYLRRVLKMDAQVISAGTGIGLRKENVDLIKKSGIVVLLEASPEVIKERLMNDPRRTTINAIFDTETLQGIMKETEDVYRDIADLTIMTDDKNIEQISKEIVETLGFTM